MTSFGARRAGTLLVYLAAAVVYITVGVFVNDLLLSVVVAIAYLLVAVWLVPAAVRRLR
jgi:hypothetical protein